MRRQEEEQSRILCELSALVYNMLRSPMSVSDGGPPARSLPEITPAGFASLLFGMSLALMVCGSVTFVLGFMLMPWVIGLVLVLYVAGVLSSVSSFLAWVAGPRKDVVPLHIPGYHSLSLKRIFKWLKVHIHLKRFEVQLLFRSGNFGEELNKGMSIRTLGFVPVLVDL
ncbi:hypothetical protein RIF29_41892 [Crotalaria pallida]|uniref:Uncharacterized protein n=1 Tax=Crotalaria pallida TaxID=3830 RepID=A0AAN9E775_CROPI